MTTEIAGLTLTTVVFPDEAGDLQRRGATAALARLLGGNYDRFHAFLNDEVGKLGGFPDPRNYPARDIERFGDDCARLSDLERAEWILRRCRDVTQGTSSSGVPLFDEEQRLVSATEWVPPATPPEVPTTSSPRGSDMWPE